MSDFDEACIEFVHACDAGRQFKHVYLGAAYRTRIESAFAEIKRAYEKVCEVDDRELGRPKAKEAQAE